MQDPEPDPTPADPGRPPRSYERPFGDVVATTATALTWNVWGRFGPWRERQAAILHGLRATGADLIVLQESWADRDGGAQASELAGALGFSEVHADETFLFSDEWAVCFAVLSRWPISGSSFRAFAAPDDAPPGAWGGAVLTARVEGPRGPLSLSSVAMDFPAAASATRQASARQLVDHLAEVGERLPLVVGGDLNATPDSDEVRLLTGRTAPARPGFALRDAWDAADPGDPGHTWSADNPWAAPLLLPSRRIDYLFTSPPGRHGVGHVTSARVHRSPVDGVVPSDHHPVVATLRY